MNAEIICIGTELLLGHIVNSNQAYISQKLAEIGVNLYFHTTVGDNPSRLSYALKSSHDRADITITTGGLGPTVDDITTEVVSKTFEKKLILKPQILRRIKAIFKRRNIAMPEENIRQAYIPQNSIILDNKYGTAPGFILKTDDNKYVACLPGVPSEMKEMMEDVIKFIKSMQPRNEQYKIVTTTLKIVGLSESYVDSKVTDLLNMATSVTVGIYAHPGEVELKITARGTSPESIQKDTSKIVKIIQNRFKGNVLPLQTQSIEEDLNRLLIKTGKTISIAESCTGGLISERITDIPGSSEYFKGSVVAYSNNVKTSILKVDPKTIKNFGAVSEETAREMAQNTRRLFNTDFSLAVTGICGPDGGTNKKPVGLVFIAHSSGNRTITKKFIFSGTRKLIKYLSSQTALNLLRTELLKNT